MTSYEPPPGVPVHCCACGESFDVPTKVGAIYPLDNGICHACWKLIRRPNHAIVAENRQLKEELAHYKLGPGVVSVDQLAATEAEVDRLREAAAAAYSHLTDGEGLGPDTSEEAVELARATLADVIVSSAR